MSITIKYTSCLSTRGFPALVGIRVAFGASSGKFNLSWHRTAAVSGPNFRTQNQSEPDPGWLRFPPQNPPLGLGRYSKAYTN
jgi:hypothetical protein